MNNKLYHNNIGNGILVTLMLFVLLGTVLTGSLPAARAMGEAVKGTNFNSNFNTNHSGWTPVIGKWVSVNSAYYKSSGVANVLSSIKHTGTYGNFIFQARMKRTGLCDPGSPPKCYDLGLIIRGNPSHLVVPVKDWYPEYWFAYNNKGLFRVWYITGSKTFVELKPLTPSTAIVKYGWNTLKVRAAGASFKFYINGKLVWFGRKSASPTGQVGIGFSRGSQPGTLNVDSASLTNIKPSLPSLNPFAEIAPDVEVPGGLVHGSP